MICNNRQTGIVVRQKSEMKWLAVTHYISQNDLRDVYGRVIEMKTGSYADFDLASMVRIYFVCLNSYAVLILCKDVFFLAKLEMCSNCYIS